jgi:hypothetical protein
MVFYRSFSPADADGKSSLQLAQNLGGHSLGAVAISALHNVASDVRFIPLPPFVLFNPFFTDDHACCFFSRFQSSRLEC